MQYIASLDCIMTTSRIVRNLKCFREDASVHVRFCEMTYINGTWQLILPHAGDLLAVATSKVRQDDFALVLM
jgi:hypothetical protein